MWRLCSRTCNCLPQPAQLELSGLPHRSQGSTIQRLSGSHLLVTRAAAVHATRNPQRAAKLAASMTAACEFVLVRHGETAWNVERRLQGQQQPGPPLNELGWQQAALVRAAASLAACSGMHCSC